MGARSWPAGGTREAAAVCTGSTRGRATSARSCRAEGRASHGSPHGLPTEGRSITRWAWGSLRGISEPVRNSKSTQALPNTSRFRRTGASWLSAGKFFSVLTRSASKDLQAGAFGYYRNDASDRFLPPRNETDNRVSLPARVGGFPLGVVMKAGCAWLLAFGFLMVARPGSSQTTGSIEGRVLDGESSPLASAL